MKASLSSPPNQQTGDRQANKHVLLDIFGSTNTISLLFSENYMQICHFFPLKPIVRARVTISHQSQPEGWSDIPLILAVDPTTALVVYAFHLCEPVDTL
jgi:hypothetical protein